MQINGLRAMVVGGASGMARAAAEKIAAGGGEVAILDLEKSAGAEVAAAIGGSFHPCNVMDYEGVEVVINEAVAALGGLDAAINTAGGGRGARTIGKEGRTRSTNSGSRSSSTWSRPSSSTDYRRGTCT